MREEENDLSFADFGGSERLYLAPTLDGDDQEPPSYLGTLARREGRPDPQVRSITQA